MRLINGILDYRKPWSTPDIYLFTGNPIRRKDGGLVMGRGAARMVRDAYPGIDQNIITQGHVSFTKITDDQVIGWFMVKDHWARPAKIELIQLSSEALALVAQDHSELTFHLNAPGVGNGQLAWADVEPVLQVLPDNVLVYL